MSASDRAVRQEVAGNSGRARPLQASPKALLLLFVVTAVATLASPLLAAAGAASPSGVSLSLDGCRNNGTVALPDANGDFICPDSAYTSGNLGPGWNELDLVPYRVTSKAGNSAPASQTFTFAIVLDSEDDGSPGYDVLSVPVLNEALSDDSCQDPTVSEERLTTSFGGVDESRYRLVTITQEKNTTCVYDYYGRLALGASGYPGASLHANLANENLGTAGIGSKEVSIPVRNALQPQDLSKTMSATQDSDHAWDISKSPAPASVNFGDTCDPDGARSIPVSIQVTWEKLPATASGDITVITHVTATNPASRVITVSVSDVIRSGTTVLDTSPTQTVDVPANTALEVLTHTVEVPAGTTNLNDVATASYIDKATGVAVPGQTQATASADVQSSGVTLNDTATITDVESLTGSGLQYSADSFTGATGAWNIPYVEGARTAADVGWTSTSQSGNGSVTFAKTIYVGSGITGSGVLSDVATLTGSDGFSTSANGAINITASARVSLTVNKTIPDVLQQGESQTFTFSVEDADGNVVATPSVNFGAGDTSKAITVDNLAPGTYTVSENAATGWAAQESQDVTIALPNCSGSATFNNVNAPATAKAVKVTDPVGAEAGWDMTLTGPGATSGETVATGTTGTAAFSTVLQEGSYTIAETQRSGWDKTGQSGDCSFTVDYPRDAGREFTCTITNVQRGSITVEKVTDPAGDPTEFTFAGDLAGDIADGESIGPVSVAPGTYSTAETVPAGWRLTNVTCTGDADSAGDKDTGVSTYRIAPGENVTCTYTNTKLGSITVEKVTDPAGDPTEFTFAGNLAGDISDGESISEDVLPGTYTTTETVPSGWRLTDITCTGDANSAGDKDTGVSTYRIAAGENVTCTYTNTKQGSITVEKVTNPAGDATEFAFAGDLEGDIADGGSIGPVSVAPGTYTTTETVPDGWRLTNITCRGDSNSAGDKDTAVATYRIAAGENVTCTYTNTKLGSIRVEKVTDPASDTTTEFTFTGDLDDKITNGGSIQKSVLPGTYTTTETVPAGWRLTNVTCTGDSDSAGDRNTRVATYRIAAGENVTCTYTNTQQGHAKVIKTVSGAAPTGMQQFTFQLRTGASPTTDGTVVESGTASALNGGIIEFETELVPGATYQLCELVMPAWSTTLGTFVPGSFMPPSGYTPNPNVDNSTLCANFTVAAGETKVFAIDNTPPPGGRALTIGFWKNWSSCTKGGQKPELDRVLATFTDGGVAIGNLFVDTCPEAVAILNKSSLDGKKMASDPAYNLAAQLLAAELNFQAGAGKCAAAVTAQQQAQALLKQVGFNGTGAYLKKMSASQQTLANQLARTLDEYNNNRLC